MPPSPPPPPGSAARQQYLLGRLLRLTGRYGWRCLGLVLLNTSLLALGLAGLGGVGMAIDFLREQVQPGAPVAKFPFGWHPPADWAPRTVLLVLGIWIFVAAAIRAWLGYLTAVSTNRLGQGRIVVELRSAIYAKMQRMSFRFFDANATGSLINRVTGDTQSVRLFIDGVAVQALNVLLATAFYLVCLVQIHAGLAFACFAFLPLLALVVVVFSRWLRPDYEEGRLRVDRLVLVFEELARGMGVVKSFGLQSWAEGRFLEANDAVRDQKNSVFRKLTILFPLVSLLNQLSLAVLLGYGGWLAVRGEIPVGTGLILFAGILQQLNAQANAIGTVADSLQQTLTGADRVYEILDAEPGIFNREDAVPLGRAKGEVVFEHVAFRFKPENSILHDLSLTVKAGEKIAIVGPTGAGKTALIQLIPRFYDPDEGRLVLDGRDLREWCLDDVRKQVGLVFQESFLFSASVAANIAFGNPGATREAVERAAQLAAASEFIETLPLGYDTLLHENGANLSGGQRQRLALARAILLDPAILILDDPTAAVDTGTEQEILTAMDRVMAGRTTFIVAHRFSTVRRAARAVVMAKGLITAVGTGEELAGREG
ncbi:MAG TPA: ABC transporter ATP-binding protein, partial [Verrucomicrobiales bacterium]|nr:ABC transporter ATP-binding protein [Verrucomicrobiales bacterium]